MTATIDSYRAPFITQRGVDTTLDDCAVVATIHGLAYATLGEYTTTPQGREMGKAQGQALARRMRRSLQPADADGLNNAQQQQMSVKAGFPAPKLLSLRWSTFVADLKSRRSVYSIGGNPARIKGSSPLKRCDCAHEWLVAWDEACGPDKLRVYDGLRPTRRINGREVRTYGEVRPASEVRQMCFKDDGSLSGVLEFPIGKWTAAELRAADIRQNKLRPLEGKVTALQRTNKKLADKVKVRDITIKGLRAQLAECDDPGDPTSTEREKGWEAAIAEMRVRLDEMQDEGVPA